VTRVMRYKALKSEHALETLEKSRRGETPDEQVVLETRGTGPGDVREIIAGLREKLDEIRSRYPKSLRRRDPKGGQFEREACSVVHRALPFDPRMLADYEFWMWLAVLPLRSIVEWRHGGETGKAAASNFGIGNGPENLFYRMWLRAEIAYCPHDHADPYELARRGDQDFWRSHVFRQGYGRCRSLVRALVRYQFPDRSGHPTLSVAEIRELAKRLRRLHPSMIFECLEDQAAFALVQREAEAVKRMVKGR